MRERVKALGFERHKLVVMVRSWHALALLRCQPDQLCQGYAVGQVTLGQKQGQAQHVVSRCLWDIHTDGWASEMFENESMFCTCQARHV